MTRTITVTGNLAAQEQSVLSAKVAGRLQKLLVDLGVAVKTGELIAQVEPRDYELRLQQSSAALAQARAELGLPLEGSDDQVELTNISSVKQVKAVLEEATRNRERIRNLSKEGIASQSELDAVESAYLVAVSRYDAALEAASTKVAMAIQRRAELEIARKQLTDCAIKAPFDGVVQSRPASIGEYVAVNTPIVTLVKIDPLRLRLEVPERMAPIVKMGQQIHLALDAVSQVFTGCVTRLSPAIDAETRMLFIEADLPNSGVLRPGSFVRAQIVINEQEESLSVPLNALVSFAGIEKVVLFQEGKALERTVTTGRRGTNWIELRSGVAKGDLVVLNPAGVRSGQKLTTKAPENPGDKPKAVKKQQT